MFYKFCGYNHLQHAIVWNCDKFLEHDIASAGRHWLTDWLIDWLIDWLNNWKWIFNSQNIMQKNSVYYEIYFSRSSVRLWWTFLTETEMNLLKWSWHFKTLWSFLQILLQVSLKNFIIIVYILRTMLSAVIVSSTFMQSVKTVLLHQSKYRCLQSTLSIMTTLSSITTGPYRQVIT